MFGYNVTIDRTTVSETHDGKEYGEWSAKYTHAINNKVTKTTDCPDVISPVDIPVGTNALVVWVEWSSGDSFGHGVCSDAEPFGIFLDMSAAKELKQQIEKYTRKGSICVVDSYQFNTSDGQEFTGEFTPWLGYFENLEEVHIDSVTVW